MVRGVGCRGGGEGYRGWGVSPGPCSYSTP